jgi:hypothetical protein
VEEAGRAAEAVALAVARAAVDAGVATAFDAGPDGADGDLAGRIAAMWWRPFYD